MKKSRYTEEQILGILKESEAGFETGELCRKHGVSIAGRRSTEVWRSARRSGCGEGKHIREPQAREHNSTSMTEMWPGVHTSCPLKAGC